MMDGAAPGTSVVPVPAAVEHLRLLIKVARMYHEQGLRQPEISERLHISQPRVSRMLKKALEIGIVRTTVVTPEGVYAQLEEEIEKRYGLREVVIADTGDMVDEQGIMPALGAAAAAYLETTLTGGDRIGISSWSSSLLAMVESMRPRPVRVAEEVVQVLGGAGSASAQAHATRLTGRLAQLTSASAVYLPAPGLVASAAIKDALVSDPNIAAVLSRTAELTLLLVGIGSLEPSTLLRESGNAIAEADQAELRRAGAVGDVCMRFFDAAGEHIAGDLDKRVIGIAVDDLRAIPRRVAVAGGDRKYSAIRASLLGGWINVLVTDRHIGERLVENAN